ncbi:MAG TPA: cytochrome P450 [Mycobacteriales bacterium]|nr:cytochrome P450 [Mycobacteriales bacterium]
MDSADMRSPFNADYPGRPHPVLDELRGTCPVTQVRTPAGRPVWLVTTCELVRAGLTDPRLSLRPAPTATGLAGGVRDGNLIRQEPPQHTRLRRLITPSFTPRSIAARRSAIESVAARVLGSLNHTDHAAGIDLMADFVHPFTFANICDVFGIEAARQAELFHWAAVLFSPASRGKARRPAFDRICQFMAAEIDRRLRQPGDDVLSAIVTAWASDDEVNREEVNSVSSTVLLSGYESTAQMLGMSVVALLTHPDELDRLRAEESLVPAGVEELLRFNTPGPSGTPRTATDDIRLAGVVIPAGDRVLLSIDAANHDPAEHHDPHTLDLDRPTAGRHVSFGLGRHYCPGAALARVELEVALTALLRRFPRLALARGVERLCWQGSHVNRSLAALPVHLGAPSTDPA